MNAVAEGLVAKFETLKLRALKLCEPNPSTLAGATAPAKFPGLNPGAYYGD
jgi:hypothetical protein